MRREKFEINWYKDCYQWHIRFGSGKERERISLWLNFIFMWKLRRGLVTNIKQFPLKEKSFIFFMIITIFKIFLSHFIHRSEKEKSQQFSSLSSSSSSRRRPVLVVFSFCLFFLFERCFDSSTAIIATKAIITSSREGKKEEQFFSADRFLITLFVSRMFL